MGLEQKRPMIVVKNADYREALADIFLPETLAEKLGKRLNAIDAQILTSAAYWSSQAQEVAIFSAHSDSTFSEDSYLNLRLMGSGLSPEASAHTSAKDIVRPIADFCPTHLIFCTLNDAILSWAVRHRIPSVVLLSEWKEPLGLKQQWQHNRLINQLNQANVEWVGAQGIHACKILETSGVSPQKIIPWEWRPRPQSHYPPKHIPYNRKHIDLIYIGPISAKAGISDVLMASYQLRSKGFKVRLDIVNDTPCQDSVGAELLQVQLQQMGLQEAVRLFGNLTDEQSLELVRAADCVLIPQRSHSATPPAIPHSLFLAMATKTPIIASDYPPLREYLSHNVNAMIFPEGNPKSMAHRIERVMGHPSLYAQLSEASEIAIQNFQIPARWSELIDHWLNDTPTAQQQLRNWALSSGQYQSTHNGQYSAEGSQPISAPGVRKVSKSLVEGSFVEGTHSA